MVALRSTRMLQSSFCISNSSFLRVTLWCSVIVRDTWLINGCLSQRARLSLGEASAVLGNSLSFRQSSACISISSLIKAERLMCEPLCCSAAAMQSLSIDEVALLKRKVTLCWSFTERFKARVRAVLFSVLIELLSGKVLVWR